MTVSERHPRAKRLRSSDEYRRVLDAGRWRRLPHLDVVWAMSESGHARLGLIVPKFQSTAVTRNRLRRRLREAWRRSVGPDLAAVDVVIRARREAYRATAHDLVAELVGWAGGVRARNRA